MRMCPAVSLLSRVGAGGGLYEDHPVERDGRHDVGSVGQRDKTHAGRALTGALDVWLRHQKIFANLLREIVVDVVAARDAGGLLGGPIHVNRVVATLAQQLAAMFFEMSNQVDTRFGR